MAKRRKSKQSNNIVKYSVIGVAVLAALMLIINFAPTGQFGKAGIGDVGVGDLKVGIGDVGVGDLKVGIGDVGVGGAESIEMPPMEPIEEAPIVEPTCVWTPGKNTWNSETELCSNPAYLNEASCLNPLWQKNTWVFNEWEVQEKCEGTDESYTKFCGSCKQFDPTTDEMVILSTMDNIHDYTCQNTEGDTCFNRDICTSPDNIQNGYRGGICVNAAGNDNVWLVNAEGLSSPWNTQANCESTYSCFDSSVNKHDNFRAELPAKAEVACAEAAGSCSDGISTTEASCLAATCVAVDPIIVDPIIEEPIIEPEEPIIEPEEPIIEPEEPIIELIPASFDLLTYQSGVCKTNIDAGDETGSAILIIEILADAKVSHYQYVEITELSDWSANNDGAFPATLSGIGDLSGTTCKIMLWRDWSGEPIINAIESSYISDI